MAAGTVVALHYTPSRGARVVLLTEAVIKDDWGLDGDRHARPGSSRQVVLVAAEVLDALGIIPGDVREQLCVRGMGEIAIGDILEIGDVRLEVTGPRVPCRVMDKVRPGLKDELKGRGGWCLRVRGGGTIAIGDRITADRAIGDPQWITDYRRALGEWEASPPEPDVPGWTFNHRIAHFIAWNERALARIAALGGGAPDEHFSQAEIDAFNASATSELVDTNGTPKVGLWDRLDTSATALVDLARAHPEHAQGWLNSLAAHFREHATASCPS